MAVKFWAPRCRKALRRGARAFWDCLPELRPKRYGVKVFVSSTSRDLADFRAAAMRSLRRLGHDVVAMEQFTAATSFPLDRGLKLVREADAYVLVVAWRIGFVPECSRASSLPATGDDPHKGDDP